VFTARYALSPYIKQIRFVFKGLMVGAEEELWGCVFADLQQTKSGEVDCQLLVQMHASQDSGFNTVTAPQAAHKIRVWFLVGVEIHLIFQTSKARARVCVTKPPSNPITTLRNRCPIYATTHTGNIATVNAMTFYMRSRGIVPLILNLRSRKGCVASLRNRPL
jgi:hypothetical protein